jgi:hypothetical protein
MAENSIVAPNLRPVFQYFYIISLVEYLTLWNEFKVYNTLDMEESDEHCFHL